MSLFSLFTVSTIGNREKRAASDHWAMRPLHRSTVKLIVLMYFSLPFTRFEPCGAVFMMILKIHLRKISSNEYFKDILHYFRVLFTLGLYNGRSMNARTFLFVALTEVQVTVLSMLNLPRQGFLTTCRALLCLQPAVICLRKTLRFANVQ